MVDEKDKMKCSGCGVCAIVCPTHAIEMAYDREGFRYPYIDKNKCINCNLCDRKCHYNSQKELIDVKQSSRFFAAFLKDKEELANVSSGGAFWGMAENMIAQRGVVYGVEQKSLYEVIHNRSDTVEECKKFRRSKYLESDITHVLPKIKEDLEKGLSVLFSGTGCQVAALYQFLGKNYSNLLTIDVVCHGVPSIIAFKKYIQETEQKYGKKIKNVIFRDKSEGWKRNQIALCFEYGEIVRELSATHTFHGAYLEGLISRPCCKSCPYAHLPRIGDITLADFWGYQGNFLEKNRDGGISLVVTSTKKGYDYLLQCNNLLYLEELREDDIIKNGGHLIHPPAQHRNRARFFKMLETKGFYEARKKYMKDKLVMRIRKKIALRTRIRKLYKL